MNARGQLWNVWLVAPLIAGAWIASTITHDILFIAGGGVITALIAKGYTWFMRRRFSRAMEESIGDHTLKAPPGYRIPNQSRPQLIAESRRLIPLAIAVGIILLGVFIYWASKQP